MSKRNIYIVGRGTVSPGSEVKDGRGSAISPTLFAGKEYPAARIGMKAESALEDLLASYPKLHSVDRSVLFAVSASREALTAASWDPSRTVGVNIGSSRGATGLFERFHSEFIASGEVRTHPLTSPLTTLGNISSWVSQTLGLGGASFSHSVTCSTALHAIMNAWAWLRAGMSDAFLAGGSEAPLTPFTIAQMRALRIYSNEARNEFPCRPFGIPASGNTMVLGEGASVFALEASENKKNEGWIEIESIGYGHEEIPTETGISESGKALYTSMTMALSTMRTKDPIDLIVVHAPGTEQGDEAELSAIRDLFGDSLPIVVSNKWLLGHTLGASGALSLDYACSILESGAWNDFPYPSKIANKPRNISKVLVNAAGFGGNAASIIVSLQK